MFNKLLKDTKKRAIIILKFPSLLKLPKSKTNFLYLEMNESVLNNLAEQFCFDGYSLLIMVTFTMRQRSRV